MNKSPPVSAWISVADELPTPNTQVVVCVKRGMPFFAFRKNRSLHPWEYLDGDTCFQKITHWMPLPPPPQ